MSKSRNTKIIVATVLLLAFLLSAAYLVVQSNKPIGAPAFVGTATAIAVDPAPTPAKEPVLQMPARVVSEADTKLPFTPKWILCGCADLKDQAWFGTDGQGVYCCKDRNWKRFKVIDGLGEATITAMACDPLGRIWAGHATQGISIYNGTQWKSYPRYSTSHGARVYCIKVCETDGDVWLATEMGLARYSLKKDSWSYFDRSTGMPDDQASSIAFDSRGDLYLGLQAGGVAVARSADQYSHWVQTLGQHEMPTQASGSGLPSSLVNAMLVTRDDKIYAGTTRGLACSTDHGNSWTYQRGKNWPDLAKGRYGGPPEHMDTQVQTPVAEDWVRMLTLDAAGVLWVGYQNAGYQTFLPGIDQPDHLAGKQFINAIIPLSDGRSLFAAYGTGAFEAGVEYSGPPVQAMTPPASPLAADAFPTPAAAPGITELDAMRKRIESLPAATQSDSVEFLPDDWETGGDWVAMYGRQVAVLLGYKAFHIDPLYQVMVTSGPYRRAIVRSYWDGHPPIEGERQVVDPVKKIRLSCENNDESFYLDTHPATQQGPDLYVRLTVPDGLHRVTLLFLNPNAIGSIQPSPRDFLVEVRKPSNAAINPTTDQIVEVPGIGILTVRRPPMQLTELGYFEGSSKSSLAAEQSPVLASSRVTSFREGVYKRLLIRGGGEYWIKVDRNHSAGATMSGIFVERLDSLNPGPQPWFSAKFNLPPPVDYSSDTGVKGAAARLWCALDAAAGKFGYAALVDADRLAAFHAALEGGIDDDTLANWRRSIHLWTIDDRDHFDEAAGLFESSTGPK